MELNTYYLFNYVGYKHKTFSGKHYFRDYHKVFLIKAKGKARPRHEVKHIAYYKPGNDVRISPITKSIIDRYYKWKERRERERKEKDRFFAVHEQSPSNYSKSCGGNHKY